MLLNVETSVPVSAVEEIPWTFDFLDAIALVLFMAFLVMFSIDAIGMFKESFYNEEKWCSRPTPAKISLIAKGVIGITIVCYIIYLLIAWSAWRGLVAIATIVIPFMFGFSIPYMVFLIFLFGYHFLYKPIVALISYFKKKK